MKAITHSIFIGSSLFNAPLWSMYYLLVFIFYRDLQASPWEVTLLLSSKPVAALISFYISSLISKKQSRLKPYLMWGTVLGALPAFSIPWLENRTLFILSSFIYMVFNRAVIPAWMEVIKLNLPAEKRSDTVSKGSTMTYVVGTFLPLLLAKWMDQTPYVWRFFFPLFAFFSLCSVLLIWKLPLEEGKHEQPLDNPLELLVSPWRNCWQLLKRRPDFAQFQAIYMLGGLGLMIILPALPIVSMTVLNLSYTENALAITVFKGIGFAMTTKMWSKLINRLNLYSFSCLVTTLAALFPLIVSASISYPPLFYIAYLVYGVMQGGSELGWNLSGPIFAKEEDSSAFTGVNVVLVGVRGLVGPFLGGGLSLISPLAPLFVGSLTCLAGSFLAYYLSQREQPLTPTKTSFY
ncbi:MAG: hypothetical protein K0S07_487 [Chlamydiales bacterium]|jgi:hypothetical protein|nr:hypothetical protein [Chlamydiales bacterium]